MNDPGGKKRSETGANFLVRKLDEMDIAARFVGGPYAGRPSFVEVSTSGGGVRIWVKTLQSSFGEVHLSRNGQFHGDLLAIVTNIRKGGRTHPNAAIYMLRKEEAEEIMDGGRGTSRTFIRGRKFREWAGKQRPDEWLRKLRDRTINTPQY